MLKCRGDREQRRPSPLSACIFGSNRCQIPLRSLEVLEEPILEDVHLVGVKATRQLDAPIADVTNRESGVSENLTLDADIPLRGIRRGQVKLSGKESWCLAKAQLINQRTWDQESRSRQRNDPAASRTVSGPNHGPPVNVHDCRPALPPTAAVVKHRGVVVDGIGDSKSATNRGLAILEWIPREH